LLASFEKAVSSYAEHLCVHFLAGFILKAIDSISRKKDAPVIVLKLVVKVCSINHKIWFKAF